MLIANFVGWLLNRAWTFGVAHPRSRQEFLRYLAVNLAGFAVTLVAVHFLVSRAGLHYLWASGCVAAGMTLINFIAHRHISFRLR
jgi:putative flippase GtrA